jgi:hypothetical protein
VKQKDHRLVFFPLVFDLQGFKRLLVDRIAPGAQFRNPCLSLFPISS